MKMKRRQLFCVALLIIMGNAVCTSKARAQYYFERDPASYVKVRDDFFIAAIGFIDSVVDDTDISVSDTGNQAVIASSTTSASAVSEVSSVTAASNTQITFNSDLVANGQVSALAMNTSIASVGTLDFAEYAGVRFYEAYSKATCDAKFTLRNSQMDPPSTQIKLKIKQSSSYAADPAFYWMPEHSFSIYKNGNPSPMLTSSASGEVTFIDPAANPGDFYVIKGIVNAEGGASYGLYFPTGIINLLGSLEVTGEAEVSVVP
tara:strand:- start:5976 stop:6758 length:783 start_codon:yes stop_codon:yes gene_type:complete